MCQRFNRVLDGLVVLLGRAPASICEHCSDAMAPVPGALASGSPRLVGSFRLGFFFFFLSKAALVELFPHLFFLKACSDV